MVNELSKQTCETISEQWKNTTTPPPIGHVAVRMRGTRQSHVEKSEGVVRKIGTSSEVWCQFFGDGENMKLDFENC